VKWASHICELLAGMFPPLAWVFRERDILGMERYGRPLDPFDPDRNDLEEGIEEAADLLVYLQAAIERVASVQRVNSDALYVYNELKNELSVIARSTERLLRLRTIADQFLGRRN
jgi:hypothetical protein